MPTGIIEHDVLDATAWAPVAAAEHRLRAAHGIDNVRIYEDAGSVCVVMLVDTIDAAVAYLAESGLPAAAGEGTISAPIIRLLEPVAVATLVDGQIRVERLWPRGNGRT